MSENKETPEEVKNTEGVEEENIDLDFEVDIEEDATEDDKDKAIKTLTAQKAHWKKKASEVSEKATEEKPEVKTESKPADEDKDLSSSDLYALIDAKVPQEDIQEVKDVARLKGISVAEALKLELTQTILEDKREKRTVAQATNTGKTAKTTSGSSDDEILANAKKGIMPESDEDMARLAQLRVGKKN